MLIIKKCLFRRWFVCENFNILLKLAKVLQMQIYIFLLKLSKQLKKNFFNYCKKATKGVFLNFFCSFLVSSCSCFSSFLSFVLLCK